MKRAAVWGVALLALLQVYPLVMGDPPVSADHTVHLDKAFHYAQLLAEGRTSGWRSNWFFGYPVGDLDAPGMELWICLTRALGLGLGSWEATYARAVAAMWCFTALSVQSWTARRGGALAGVIAAALWLLDGGEFREGGFRYFLDYGVWGQCLGMAFTLRALGRLDDALARDDRRDTVALALWTAAALLTHPMDAVLLAVTAPLQCLAVWRRSDRADALRRAATGLALGAGVASFWLAPFLARRAWTADIGDGGHGLDHLVTALSRGRVLGDGRELTLPFALAGLARTARRDRVGALVLTVWGVAFWACATLRVDGTWLATHVHALAKIQWTRFVIPAKVAWFALAGVALDGCVAWMRRPDARRVVGVLGLFALAAEMSRATVDAVIRARWDLVTASRAPWWRPYRRLAARITRERAPGFARVVTVMGQHDHRMHLLPMHTGLALYKVGYTPARQFRYAPETMSPEGLAALSAAWVVSFGRHPYPGLTLVEDLRFARLYRVDHPTTARHRVEGDAAVSVTRFDDEHIAMRVREASPGARVVLHVAAHPRWQATIDGRPAPIERARAPLPAPDGRDDYLMAVRLRPGVLRVDYVRRPIDHVGTGLSWLSAAALLAIASRRRSR